VPGRPNICQSNSHTYKRVYEPGLQFLVDRIYYSLKPVQGKANVNMPSSSSLLYQSSYTLRPQNLVCNTANWALKQNVLNKFLSEYSSLHQQRCENFRVSQTFLCLQLDDSTARVFLGLLLEANRCSYLLYLVTTNTITILFAVTSLTPPRAYLFRCYLCPEKTWTNTGVILKLNL
jgi:hypothetical protein